MRAAVRQKSVGFPSETESHLVEMAAQQRPFVNDQNATVITLKLKTDDPSYACATRPELKETSALFNEDMSAFSNVEGRHLAATTIFKRGFQNFLFSVMEAR
ncbi:unnamed protein product [Didymodactylos carnosus]|uniref:Uncharacterized protein n=1 Tax=Didymodactylos carnosus TaxID=1234261 RepID=A0A813PV46_9BILA|nr:unnamed protein product [Didymodactylos carnosus]CAF0969723.1 unnamed protein product [Didymodactylos carnosus]CAF3539353.1 unnamed protein product [Didymodactylos carnosus]CAF3741213.1 unnamed protein product [Didymodactylos carnosus]